MAFFTPWYRFRVWWYRYGNLRDFIQIGMAATTGVLAINSYSFHPQVTLIAGAVYLVLLGTLIFVRLGSRVARDNVQAEVIWGLFSHMNREIFKDSSKTRFTYFRISPVSFRSRYIIPWYRFRKNGLGAIEEAKASKARYKRGEGFTGKAWDDAGVLYLGSFPEFVSRSKFEDYYIDTLKIEQDIARDLSDHMVGVRTIFTYGFTGSNRKLLGVFSLDLPYPVTIIEEAGKKVLSMNDIEIDAQAFARIIDDIGNVLESFQNSERT